MISLKKLAVVAFAVGITSTPAYAELSVVTSIKPIQSLVAGVMQGLGEPEVILKGASSPHSYAMRPSEAQSLQDADVVFWVGPELETFLTRAIENIGNSAKVVPLANASGLTLLPFREGGAFEAHDHGHEGHDHAHGKHDHAHDKHDHAHDKHDHAHDKHDHAHDKHDHAHDKHEHHHEAHAHGENDPHVWLDPVNASVMTTSIAAALSEADPQNAERYRANAAQQIAALETLVGETEQLLAAVQDRPFIVFHDAYQYFENRFGLEAAGAITINPETPPSAERVSEIRQRVSELDAACTFAEPQFEPRVISVISEGLDAKSGVLDPLGADLEEGPALYGQLIRNMAQSFRDCLTLTN